MRDGSPAVLAATVSGQDRRVLERTFEEAGLELRLVDAAEDVERELASGAGLCVLVIDSGLLFMPHDAQWRQLRARRPELGTVVRCLTAGRRRGQRGDGRTLLVHPDHGEALLHAVRVLAGDAVSP